MTPFEIGFVKRCQFFGMDKESAQSLFAKLAGGSLDADIDALERRNTAAGGGAKPVATAAPALPAAKPVAKPPLQTKPIQYASWNTGKVQNPHFNPNATQQVSP